MKRLLISWRFALLLIPAVAVALGMLWARFAPSPPRPRVTAGRLTPCPDRPNCVCSQATDALHAADPLPMLATPQASIDRLTEIIRALPRTTVRENGANYMHVEFRSRLMGFVDDVEFYVDPQAGLIHFRSASRLGYSDLGVNRDRMEQIRRAYLGS